MKKISRKKELMDRLIREEVVETVLTLIREDRPVTMEDVALKCGVAKGTLYNYFKDKNDLLAHVHECVISPIKQSAEKLFAAPISPREKIHAFVENVFEFHKEYPLYFKFIQAQRSAAEAETERMELAVLPLLGVCREGIQRGDFLAVDPYAMAGMIFGCAVGSMESMPYRDTPVEDMERLKKDIICLLDRIILKPPWADHGT
jgi:AcrR family transcriptional regulator